MAHLFAPGLDLSRSGRLRRHKHKRLARLFLVFVLLGGVWHSGSLVACCLALPEHISALATEALLPGYRHRLLVCEAENRTLRAQAGAAAALAEENAALRALQPGEDDGGRSAVGPESYLRLFAATAQYTPCRVAALRPAGFTIAGAGLQADCGVVDAHGRLLGITVTAGREALVQDAGQAGLLCRIGNGGAVGGLVRRAGRLWVIGLPRGVALAPGDVAVTLGDNRCPAGLWVGQAATAPVPEEGGLTAAVPLADCAGLPYGVCYLVQPE